MQEKMTDLTQINTEQERCLQLLDDQSVPTYYFDNVNFKTNDTTMTDEIKQAYIKMYKEKVEPSSLKNLLVNDDGQSEFVDVAYDTHQVPFSRIRRITGYLVGDVSRWNNGKRAEERDRVFHSSTGTDGIEKI